MMIPTFPVYVQVTADNVKNQGIIDRREPDWLPTQSWTKCSQQDYRVHIFCINHIPVYVTNFGGNQLP